MKYWFMDQHRSSHGVQKMCRVIGASRSGYYRWRRQPKGKRQKENEKILMEIRESHKNSRRAYGSPRITGDLQAKGMICGENRVARLMKINGIVGKAKKKFKATTNSKHNLPVAENLLNQNFEAEKPNTTWVSDITYIWTLEGWTRANLVDRDILSLLKRAGLIRISYGLESGDPEILKIIRKEVSQEDMLKAFKLTAELGIEPACSVMLGLPGETRASVEKTISFVSNIPEILYANFSIANPYPGTEMYNWALTGKHGIHLLIKDFSEYRRYDHSPISVNDLGPEDLVRLQKIGLLRMHMKPKRIWAAIKMVGFVNLIPLFLSFVKAAMMKKIAHLINQTKKEKNL